jgi:protoheme IX farnesyltransferase
MQEKNSISNSTSFVLASKVKDYFLLIKFTLSFMVVFSTVISYLLAPNIRFDLLEVLLLFTGGMLVTGSANTINQVLEKLGFAMTGTRHDVGVLKADAAGDRERDRA